MSNGKANGNGQVLETSKRWTVQFNHGGIGSLYWTRYEAMVDMVCEVHWTKAVLAAGFSEEQIDTSLLQDRGLQKIMYKAIHKPALVRKVWRRLNRRKDGSRIMRVTVQVSKGWA